MTGPRGGAPALPDVDASVELEGEDWPGPAQTRVEDLTTRGVVVAAPGWPEAASMTRPGALLQLTWTTPEALYELPVTLATRVDDARPTWTLAGPVADGRPQASGGARQ